ncbi:MAG: radical SAM protein [Candidatus Omnitrophica bacterium]|nr:radical SAM protein [Candidatus Omnitrophota bacterium]
MKKSGCIQVDLGVESGSLEVLKRLKKGISVEEIKRVFSACRKVGMRTFANILINVPDETEDEINETLKLLDEIHPTVTSFNIFIPYVGTAIYNQYKLELEPKEYALLNLPPRELARNPRFRFAKHNIDFNKFYVLNHKKYNSPFTFLPDYFSSYYLNQLIRSKKKKDYLSNFKDLIKEYVKQAHQK